LLPQLLAAVAARVSLPDRFRDRSGFGNLKGGSFGFGV